MTATKPRYTPIFVRSPCFRCVKNIGCNPTKPIIPVKIAKTVAPKKQPIEAELPDTLGQGIFESEENVRIAMQILCECEATIRQEKQQTRNYIIETTFNALPQAENALLVTNENGDFEVIEVSEQTAIEI